MENPSEEILNSWHKNKKNWKLGIFYFNKEDKRLIVDKPNPNYGSTLNFANKKSYSFLILCMIFFGFIVYMITQNQ
jgi:uncharacterized membrane protein